LAPKQALYREIIRLRKNKALPNRYDVEMQGVERLRPFDRLECDIVLYPYSRQICSDDIHFYPFEEYVHDVLSNQRSAYAEIKSPMAQIFGLLLGLAIALAFARFRPQSLLQIESIVSVFGAYAIGKEVWDDIENLLVNVSKNWRLRYTGSYYRYRLEKRTTLTYYSYLAKRQRYGRATLLPEKIDFIKQSNSQTLRMYFNTQDLASLKDSMAHIHSIHIDEALIDDFQEAGYMFGVKLSFDRLTLGLCRCFEVFQSINKASVGCLDETGQWVQDAAFYRYTLSFGRLKLYVNQGMVRDVAVIDREL
jgi:hypothetical protein